MGRAVYVFYHWHECDLITGFLDPRAGILKIAQNFKQLETSTESNEDQHSGFQLI